MHKRWLPWLMVFFALGEASAVADPRGAQWLAGLRQRVAQDVLAGRPLVAQVHVPLCENTIIPCGSSKLGDGDNPHTNLYWSTSGGFLGWFRSERRWTLVFSQSSKEGDVLERRVWHRRVRPSAEWRKRGVWQPFDVYVVAYAWRGTSIAKAIGAYLDDLYGDASDSIRLPDGTTIAAGGGAHIVAYVGHNGWMDLPGWDWERQARRAHSPTKGTIAVACLTADYLATPVSAKSRVPLLMTTSLLFAGAHAFEGAVGAFAEGGSLGDIRRVAAGSYARGQKKPFGSVVGAFTNPSDRRWHKY